MMTGRVLTRIGELMTKEATSKMRDQTREIQVILLIIRIEIAKSLLEEDKELQIPQLDLIMSKMNPQEM